MQQSTSVSHPASAGFTRLCLVLLGATVALIALGGLVRITGSGLGCPDWPLCHGHLIPPMALAPWIEYFHRLAAASVSLLITAFCVVAWWRYRGSAWVIWPAGIAPVLLVAQILLGRLTVLNEIPPTVAWIHTAVAMAILACVAVPVCATYPPLVALSRRLAGYLETSPPARRLPSLFGLSALAVYLLLLTGAYVTRSGAAAACTGFPGCGVELGQGAARRLQDVHMLHRLVAAGAGLVLAAALAQTWQLSDRGLRRLAAGTGLILLIQIGLGATNVLLALPLWSRGLHLTVAAVLWAAVMILTVVAWRGWRMGLTAAGDGQSLPESAARVSA